MENIVKESLLEKWKYSLTRDKTFPVKKFWRLYSNFAYCRKDSRKFHVYNAFTKTTVAVILNPRRYKKENKEKEKR